MASHMPSDQELVAMYGGGPYPPRYTGLGSPPEEIPDVPITAVFLVLFLFTAVANMTLFQGNRKHGHFFVFSGAMFGFCLIRTVSCILRIATVYYNMNVSLAIAAQVFVAAGTVIMFIINLFFAQRIVRARHPNFGWHNPIGRYFPMIGVFFVLSSLFMIITVVIQTFFTLDRSILKIDRDVQLYGVTMFAILAFIPIPIILVSYAIPRKVDIDHFGAGDLKTKAILVIACATLLTLGAAFRAGTTFLTPTPRGEYRWYYSKACFYLFDFTIDWVTVFSYLMFRVDRQFHVPNKVHGRGHMTYSKDREYYNRTGIWPNGNPLGLSPPHQYDMKDPDSEDSEKQGALVQ